MKCNLEKNGERTFLLCMIPHCKSQPQLGDYYNNFPTVRKICQSQRGKKPIKEYSCKLGVVDIFLVNCF